MRVLLTSFSWDTHFQSLVPLAWALRTAGHEVRVASQPSLAPAITGAGLTAVPVGAENTFVDLMGEIGADIQVYASGIDLDDPRKGGSWEYLLGLHTTLVPTFYAMVNDDTFVDGLLAFTREWQPDLIIWEQFTFAGGIVGEATGTPHCRLVWGPDLLAALRQEFLRVQDLQPLAHHDDPMGEWLGWTARRLGFPFTEDLVTGQWTVDTMPASMRLATGLPTVPMQYVAYNGPATVPDWLRRPPERPRVCLTLGISARQTIGDNLALPELLAALADVDAEIVATLHADQRDGLGPLPANVRLEEFVPLHVLLPTCAAIVHHGGAGTWATAAAGGVPQIIIGEMYDVAVRGRQIAAAGAGIQLDPTTVDAATLRDGIVRLLTEESFRVGAARVRAEMCAEPAPGGVVAALEERALSRSSHVRR